MHKQLSGIACFAIFIAAERVKKMDKHQKILKSLTAFMLALMLGLTSVTYISEPAYAAASTTMGTATATSSTPAYPSAKRVTIAKYDLTFASKVRTDRTLGSASLPRHLLASGARNSVKLTWTPAKDLSSIDGYVIARKDASGSRWRQIAKVSASEKSYKDTTATVKNRLYSYTVVAYKKTGSVWTVTRPLIWAGAVSSNSSKQNVKAFSFVNPARISTVKIGVKKKLALSFSYKDPVSKTIRWTSSNKAIAKVNSKGEVTGVSRGTVTLSGRTHTGNIIQTKVKVIKPGTAQAIVDVMASWINFSEVNRKHEGIIDIYNSVKPWPRGYKVKYSDEWCATCVSAAAIMSGTSKYTNRECGVPQFITYFKSLGRWEEDGSVRPKPGYLIIYGWSIGDNVTVFGNDWSASHIGVVESVKGNQITVIEGNMGAGTVGRRTIKQGWRFIRGYCRPNYKK